MPSLLEKLSFYDPDTNRAFVVADDGFYWKQGKKAPEASKVTKLVGKHGWKLWNGNDAWLIFSKKGSDGELFVVRGNKRWFYSVLGETLERGEGLPSLREALESGKLDAVAKAAGSAAIAVNNAGRKRGSKLLSARGVDWDQELAEEIRSDRIRDMEDEAREAFERDPDIRALAEREGAGMDALWAELGREYADQYWEPRTASAGLGRRRDYGEGKEACLVLSGGVKTASGERRVDMYVSSVEWKPGSAFRLAGFGYSSDPADATAFLPLTAANLARQIRGLCGQTPKLAKPADLITTQNIKTQKKYQPSLITDKNIKTQKGEKLDFLTGVMHLMPSDLSGYGNVCPCASPECRQMCLNTAGKWVNTPAVQNARRVKTELYFKDRAKFMEDLRRSIESLVRKAEKQGKSPAIRINGTSDLPQVAMQMAKEYPQVQFYDYTKIPQPWKRQLPNYHITFSRSETNDKDAMEALEHGVNVAVVFGVPQGQPLPGEWRGYPVIDGDKHDLRFLDKLEGEGPFIVGLRGKGKARGEGKGTESGFVIDPAKQRKEELVQIAPAPPARQEEEKKPEPVSTTEERIKERDRPATKPEESKAAAQEHPAPSVAWFVEGCFDDAHLYA